MRVGEAHPLRGELVEVRRGDLAARRIVGVDVAIAEVVGVEEDDVRLACVGGAKGQRAGEEREQ